MKVVTVIGARPQFIKAAPVSRVLRKRGQEILVHTGQHYDRDMSEVFFKELDIPDPDYHLEVRTKYPGARTGEMLAKVEEVLLQERPDGVLVYGDTDSTLAGAMAAAKLHIPIAHVEAGLRSYNRRMPEELNRVVTDHLSHLLCCPTKTAVCNLSAEGIREGVCLTGDVMVDAIRYNLTLAETQSSVLTRLQAEPGSYLLITVHRAENTTDPERLRQIAEAVNRLNRRAIWPIHPGTRKKMEHWGIQIENEYVQVIQPVGYLDMLKLEAGAERILTDSGGVQKEAYLLQKPCITMRDETEWTETVELNANRLVGAHTEKILEAVESFHVDFAGIPSVFGDGHASKRIVDQLWNTL
ncbi:UDP-N-acetylglucosamine 2-epimerase (non-hydrolyzing) [Kroppenstedtia pulmonis]|uniref:UDP-N-acetylglucosamine 2-epimerase (Non-hydrolyzing) n=1 Tax=Kroppenstedtia pulmonis TaxID=1380685 RepID=A0A7D4BXT9_9BACL|nr:UDP-N-acetylglucosamine 2-epimerase (non-hydrolyzing) [Kroppenstedtia pulmonis]QKG85693.1 UDP-N-acetylglucosamine 2-epimerase (non-hydrolyzing) [Kroppenstedtia pulmonis]